MDGEEGCRKVVDLGSVWLANATLTRKKKRPFVSFSKGLVNYVSHLNMRLVASLRLNVVHVLDTSVVDDDIEAVEFGSPPSELVDAGKGPVVEFLNMNLDTRSLR